MKRMMTKRKIKKQHLWIRFFKHILPHNQLFFFSCFHPNIVSLMFWLVVGRADGVGFSECLKNVWNETNPKWRIDLSSTNEFGKPDSQSLILKTSAMLGRSIAAWKHRTEDVGNARPIYRSVLCIFPICTKLSYMHTYAFSKSIWVFNISLSTNKMRRRN